MPKGDHILQAVMTSCSSLPVDGKTFARCIKSVTNKNQSTPIIAVSAYEMAAIPDGLFDASISKPIRRLDLIPLLLAMGHQSKISVPDASPSCLNHRISQSRFKIPANRSVRFLHDHKPIPCAGTLLINACSDYTRSDVSGI